MKNKTFRSSFLLSVLSILLMLSFASSTQAENTPPIKSQTIEFHAPLNSNARSGSVFVNNASIGQVAWTQLADAGASDDQRARAALQAGQVTNYLKATGFGFNVPANAAIGGVVVEVEHSAKNLITSIKDKSIKLVKGGSIVGQNRVLSPNFLSTSDDPKQYGSSTDMWGVTLTPDEINGSDFGVVVAYEAFQADTARVDNIRITIHYSSRLYDTDDSSLTWTPGWDTITDDRANGRFYKATHSPYDIANVCLSFSGAERVGVGRVVGTNQGTMKVKIDGVEVAGSPFDNHISYSDGYTTTMHSFIWVKEDLTTSSHTVCVEDVKTDNDEIGFDYFVIAKGNKMAQRGASLVHGTMKRSDINAHWYYERTPTTADDWDGYVPHHYGLGDIVSVCSVINMLNSIPSGKPAPDYWILMNEEDWPIWFTPTTYRGPDDTSWANNLYTTMMNIKDAYTGAASCSGMTKNLPAPKMILTIGSQYHAPPGTGKYGNGNITNWCSGGSNDPNDPDPWHFKSDRQGTWHCQHLGASWIAAFWQTLVSQHANAPDYVAGFAGNFYPPDVDVNGYSNTENLNPQHVADFARDLKDWALGTGIDNPEVWIKELGSWVWGCPEPPNGNGGTIDAQKDNTTCGGTTYAIRNFIGATQDKLGNQGVVNRWAWYADRYGGYHQCSAGGDSDTNPKVYGNIADGEFLALNASCSGTPTLSPFGNNFSVAAPYR